MDEPAWLSVRSGTELDVWTTEVVLTGCSGGVGLGLDDDNCVTEVVPGLPAGLSGRIAVGDRVVSVDSQPLGGRKLQTIIHPRERHVFEVEKHGMKPLEAFTLQKRRLSRGQSGWAQVDPADHRRRSSSRRNDISCVSFAIDWRSSRSCRCDAPLSSSRDVARICGVSNRGRACPSEPMRTTAPW